MSQHAFSSLELQETLIQNAKSLGFESMTAIQALSLPFILAGQDVIAQGQTGSGKTAAFGLGLLNKIDVSNFSVQALVLCPTRELAEQVSGEIRRLGRSIPNVKLLTLYGGTPIKAQTESLAKGVHIVVGTPGRIEDHLNKGSLPLESLNTLVLDEADRMLDMGFQKTLDAIIELIPRHRQTLLFSATYPPEIESIAQRITTDAEFLKVAPSQDTVRIDETLYRVANEKERMEALQRLLMPLETQPTVVFCNTRADTQSVAGGLKSRGFSAAALHGDMEQKDRDQTLLRFANGSINVLVATDVAARGLDIESLDVVINYHLPKELEVYTHRIGRTGRAGAKGYSYSIFQPSEEFRITKLEGVLGRSLPFGDLPPLAVLDQTPARPLMSTLRIEGGKKQKLRPGDLVGALTKNANIDGTQLGKIQIMDNWAYIAVERPTAKLALQTLNDGKIKGKSFRCRLV